MPISIHASLLRSLTGAALILAAASAAAAEEHEFAAPLSEIAEGLLQEIAQNPIIIAAVIEQNAKTGGYDAARIAELDKQWEAEVGAANRPLIDAALGGKASVALLAAQEAAVGLITELFVMDAKGLNVAQSTITSDYWQGDEDKFILSYGAGVDGVTFGEIEQDESTQAFQSQVSITIVDPANGAPIGAVTAGIDLAML